MPRFSDYLGVCRPVPHHCPAGLLDLPRDPERIRIWAKSGLPRYRVDQITGSGGANRRLVTSHQAAPLRRQLEEVFHFEAGAATNRPGDGTGSFSGWPMGGHRVGRPLPGRRTLCVSSQRAARWGASSALPGLWGSSATAVRDRRPGEGIALREPELSPTGAWCSWGWVSRCSTGRVQALSS
jgi:hypothetical protein